jgi:hypothetical protein
VTLRLHVGQIVALGLLATVRIGAQEAEPRAIVTGQVTAAESHDPIASAYVIVEGTTLGAVTDSTGHYRVAGVPPGPQVLAVRRIGYAPVRVPLIVPTSGVFV